MPTLAFRWIPPGTLTLKDPVRQLSHTHHLDGFYLASHCVTQQQYQQIMGHNPSLFHDHPNHPVETVNWWQALAFCNALSLQWGLTPAYRIEQCDESLPQVKSPAKALLRPDAVHQIRHRLSSAEQGLTMRLKERANGVRLPLESQWQLAASDLTPKRIRLADHAWFEQNSGQRTHEVGQKCANQWGLFDLLGNVWEWCECQYHPDYGDYRVIRGGGFADPERGCLPTNRRRTHPSLAIEDLGFRLVLTKASFENLSHKGVVSQATKN